MIKKALLIGINYKDTPSELNGCIEDVTKMRDYLASERGYREEDIMVLTDFTPIKPTKENLLGVIGEFFKLKSDVLFFHYSGHGSSTVDRNGDERDGKDETVLPLDYTENGGITDDELRGMLSKVSSQTRVFLIFDCCHSGTMLDLPYNLRKGKGWRMDKDDTLLETEGEVICVSGCLDNQTSSDAYLEGRFQGALTYSFLRALVKGCDSLEDVFKDVIRTLRKEKFSQIPSISSGKNVNLKGRLYI